MEKPNKKRYKIIVNAQEKDWHDDSISYEEVVILAFSPVSDNPNVIYTVSYLKGPRSNPEGSMVAGQTVKVKNKMIFNASQTDKS